MKKRLLMLTVLVTSAIAFGQVGINTDSPNNNADLELASTNKALLLNRVTAISDVATPTDGMVVYDATSGCFKGYQGGAWVDVTTCSSGSAYLMFNHVEQYNGVSVSSYTIGYNGEAVPSASTIDIEVTATHATPYSFTANDATTGLSYSASGNFAAAGTYTVTLNNNGVTIDDTTYGTINMILSGASNTLYLEPRIDIKSVDASNWVEGVDFQAVTAEDGNVWMDRNLGASRVAISSNDVLSFGNLYQWGRDNDGHEIIVMDGIYPTEASGFSGTTLEYAHSSTPGHSYFIETWAWGEPFDWLFPKNDTLWQGESGVNNPCPSGYRLPTEAEWTAYVTAANITNSATAASSDLAIPNSGIRHSSTNIEPPLIGRGIYGYYWSSSTFDVYASYRYFGSTSTSYASYGDGGERPGFRADGFAVRCIKD